MENASDGRRSVVRGRGRPRSDAAHRAILKAALDVLAERGYEALTFEAVAASAGVGRPTIYRRWKRKEDLVAAALEDWRPITGLPDRGSLDADLEGAIETMKLFSDQSMQLVRIVALMVTTLAVSEKVRSTWISKYFLPRWDTIRAIFRRAVERGELAPRADIEELTVLCAAIMWYRYMPMFIQGKKRAKLPDPTSIKASIYRILEPYRLKK